jgi:hypothetical protein
MTKEQVKAVLDRVLDWPEERQEDAAEMLRLIEQHDSSPYRLNDEQAAEVRRRLADKDAPSLTLTQLDARLRRLGV